MARRILLIILIFTGSCAFAQLGVPLSQYSGNLLVFNPAYAGLDGELSANLSVRRQWVQLPNAPSLVSFNVHAPFDEPNHAWGVAIQRETWAALNGNFAYLNYAYNLFIDEGLLSLGVQAGVYNHVLDWDKIEHIIHREDPILGKGREQKTKFDVNFGAYYLTNNYYVGFSVKHLAPPKFSFAKEISNQTWYPHMGTQFFLMGGIIIPLEDEYWSLRPEMFVRYVSRTRPAANVGLLAGYQGRYFFGMSYQTGQHTVSFSIRGLVTNGLRFGYSYDVPLGVIRTAQSGSHEISVSCLFNNLIRKTNQKKKIILH
jgi:type IX secretion system PorP/SprF family membrane protein